MPALDDEFSYRHSAVVEKLRWLEPNPNLPAGTPAAIAALFRTTAAALLNIAEADNPQLTLALQHLIDAKDCAVRAVLR